MADTITPDQKFAGAAAEDARNARNYGIVFIISGLLLQILHLFPLPVRGFPYMVIIAGIILAGSGILFILGSYTVPSDREGFIERLQNIMLDHNPDRRLWAAQRLIGYARDANFTKEQILKLAKEIAKVIKDPPVSEPYKPYVAVDHLILLRELAVGVEMDRHTRKDFVRIIRPLEKLEGLSDEAYELLADAVAYHPDKLPVQAYSDLQKQRDDLT